MRLQQLQIKIRRQVESQIGGRLECDICYQVQDRLLDQLRNWTRDQLFDRLRKINET